MSWYGSFAIPTNDGSPSDTSESSAIPTNQTSCLDGSVTNAMTSIDTSAWSPSSQDFMSANDTNEASALLTNDSLSSEISECFAILTDLVSWFYPDTDAYTAPDSCILLETLIARWDKETQDDFDMPPPPVPRLCMICDKKHTYKNNCKNNMHCKFYLTSMDPTSRG